MCSSWKTDLIGVNKFYICCKDEIGYMPVNENINIIEENDIYDFYVVVMREENNKYYLELYQEDNIIFSVNTTNQFLKVGADLKIFYMTKDDGFICSKIYKDGQHILLCKNKESQSLVSNSKCEPSKREYGDYIDIFFHYENCKRFYVAEYFANVTANEFIILPKQFEDDDTCNYLVRFSKDRLDDISFMTYCVQSEIGGYAVYGFVVDELQRCCKSDNGENNWLIEQANINGRLVYEKQYVDIVEHIYEKIGHKNLFNDPKLKYFSRTNRDQLNFLFDFLKQGYATEKFFDYKSHKEKYDRIYENLVDKGVVQVKWKSEYELYKTVKRKFADSIYQYTKIT